jgi:hypothetical protein
MSTAEKEKRDLDSRNEVKQPVRDLSSEKQAIEAAIAKQSASTREYLSGKFKTP